MAASLISVGASILVGILVPRAMGEVIFGRFALLISTYNLSALLSSLGVGLLITREFAPMFNRGERQKALGLYKAIFSVRAIAGGSCSLGVIGFLAFFTPFEPGYSWITVAMMGGLVLVLTVSETLFMLQWGAMRYAQWGLFRPMRQWTRLILILLGFKLDGLRGSVAGMLLAECLIGMIGVWLAGQVGKLNSVRADFSLLLSLKSLMLRNCVTQLLLGGANYLGPIMVALFTTDAAETSYYGLSAGFTVIIANVALRGATSFSPIFAIIVEQGDRVRLARWAGLAVRGGILGFIVMWGVFCLIGEQVIGWTVGDNFLPAYPLLVLLFAATPFRWISTVLMQLCNVYKRPELNIWSGLVQLLIFISLGSALLLRNGPAGLAFSFTLAAASGCGVAFFIVWRWLGVYVTPGRLLLSLLCAAPFVLVIEWGAAANFGGRFLLALLATGASLLMAHFTRALRLKEVLSLYSALKGERGGGAAADFGN